MTAILPNPWISSSVSNCVDQSGSTQSAAGSNPDSPPPAAEPLHPRGCPDPEWCIANNGCYWNCSYDIGGTDCISEIFHYGRKLIAEDNRRAEDFVDFAELEAALAEPLPLFIRDGEHLRMWS
jgi:hypothetical protein